MIMVAVCDDERIILEQIEGMLKEIERNINIPVSIDLFHSGKLLEDEISKGTRYDLLYLDIQMKGENGITVAKNIRKMDENLLIVYVSGYDKYLMELFRLNVFDFIKKPIQPDIFLKTFLAANEKICSQKIYFSFQYKYEEYKILCSDIIYFESKGRQIMIHGVNGETNVFNDKLNEVERRLSEGKIPFLRIHQSYLVNYHRIKARSKREIIMSDGVRLPVSEEKQKKFNQLYGRLLGGEISG